MSFHTAFPGELYSVAADSAGFVGNKDVAAPSKVPDGVEMSESTEATEDRLSPSPPEP